VADVRERSTAAGCLVGRVSAERPDVRLDHWGSEGLELLERLNAPDMTRHVGGPESAEKLIDRQARYKRRDSRQYVIVGLGGEHVGRVGYWERAWHDQEVWETGVGGRAGLPGSRRRELGHEPVAGDRSRRTTPPVRARLPADRQRAVERDLPRARLRVPG
jgi:hypothetical protein